jgi:2-methylaconitate cis-trans-isomerase PrpF
MSFGQTAIPCAYIRGGSSKATFFKSSDLPSPGALRDKVLKRVNGTPDPIQIDGMGGSRVVTSKIAVISTSEREGVDVDYTFCQVSIDTDTIEYGGNCGNISGESNTSSIG